MKFYTQIVATKYTKISWILKTIIKLLYQSITVMPNLIGFSYIITNEC